MGDTHTPSTAVYDCNVFLQGLINPNSPANRCLSLWEKGEVAVYVTRPILVEIRSVLLRPELQDKFANLTYERVAQLFHTLGQNAILMEAVPTVFRFERNIKDEPYINLAIAVGAQYLVSRDNDLLELMHSSDRVSVAFRCAHPNISIVDPVAFLNLVQRIASSDDKT